VTRSRLVRNAVAAGAAAALVAAPLLALAQEETASPEASPEPSPELSSAETQSEPAEAIAPPKTNEFSLGQSLQLRVDANGDPNSSLVDFRWSVNQLTVQGQESGDQQVPVPDRGALLRSLLDFSHPPTEDGIATLTADVQDGVGLARTVSLYPQDEDPPVAFEAAYTLDGEPIDAWDVVGKSGVLTATYTLTNLSTTTIPVEVENLAGDPVTVEVEADVPMVGIGKMLIPQQYHGLSLTGGTFGADGRGNNQVQFIALPFRPISKDGTATFGWSANVTDAVIPSMLLQVAPVYIPADDPETPVDESARGGGLVQPPPNLDPAVAQIQGGVAQLVTGVEQLTADDGGPDPLTVLETNLNEFFTEFGVNIQTVAANVDPNNPDSATAQLTQLQNVLIQVEEQDLVAKLAQAASLLTPERAQTLADAAGPINTIAENAETIGRLADLAPQIQELTDFLANQDAFVAQCTAYLQQNQPDIPGPGVVCRGIYSSQIAPIVPALQQVAAIVNDPLFRQFADLVASQQFQLAADVLAQIGPQLVPLANGLALLNQQLPGIITLLTPILDALVPALTGLSEQLAIIGGGLEANNVDLPTVDQVVENITAAILESPGGQNVTAGLGQVGSGVGEAKSLLGDWLATTIATLKAGASAAAETASDIDAAVVNVKAEVKGLATAAHQSPLPYGGDPANAPEGTVLAGAYEFRVDAADTNKPYTPARILLGLVALLAAGGLSYLVARRSSGAPVEAGESAVPVDAAVGGAAAVGAAAADTQATQAVPTAEPEEPVDDETEPGDYVVDESAEEAQDELDAAEPEAAHDAGESPAGEPQAGESEVGEPLAEDSEAEAGGQEPGEQEPPPPAEPR
jgi:hypothetical protein